MRRDTWQRFPETSEDSESAERVRTLLRHRRHREVHGAGGLAGDGKAIVAHGAPRQVISRAPAVCFDPISSVCLPAQTPLIRC
jgi:hypothetical protein